MKFVYFGYDFMLGTVRRLIQDGHGLVGIFSFPCDNVFNFNTETIALAKQLGIPVTLEKPTQADIENFKTKGTKCFFAAGYLYKIPEVEPAYGINIHPSLLPRGRSIMPIPHILLDHPEAAGFTIHKLAEKLDTGDILYQEALPLKPAETVETLSTRMALHAPKAMSSIMEDLPKHWKNAKEQNEADAQYFPPPNDAMRLLDWALPLERLDQIARAFGHFGSLARLGDSMWAVYSHEIRRDNHNESPGTILSNDNEKITVAAQGGVFILRKFEKLAVNQ